MNVGFMTMNNLQLPKQQKTEDTIALKVKVYFLVALNHSQKKIWVMNHVIVLHHTWLHYVKQEWI